MRTLVIATSLPHLSFDNHDFLSAPSLADYKRVIVDLDSVSCAIADVVSGSAEQQTYTGVPVANANSTTETMGLAEMLTMRSREAEWFLGSGGTMVCFAHPDVAVKGVRGLNDWRRYSWLPSPDGFVYADDLQASFGKVGAEAAADHAFGGYIEAFARRAGYRVRVNEEASGFADYGQVFARSEGGAGIGFELKMLEGSIVYLPPLIRGETDRNELSRVLFECFERKDGIAPVAPNVSSEVS